MLDSFREQLDSFRDALTTFRIFTPEATPAPAPEIKHTTWYTTTDKKTGRLYFYNDRGAVQWDEPAELHEPGAAPLWRIDGLGEQTRFSIYVDQTEPTSLGRRQLGKKYTGISRSQAVLWCDTDGLLAVKSQGLNPTCILVAGTKRWEQLFNGMKRALGPGDALALDPANKEATKFVVNPTREGQERLERLAADAGGLDAAQLTARTSLDSPRPAKELGTINEADEPGATTPAASSSGAPTTPASSSSVGSSGSPASDSMATQIARRRWNKAVLTPDLRMKDFKSPRGHEGGMTPRHEAVFAVGDTVLVKRTNGSEDEGTILKFEPSRGSYLVRLPPRAGIMKETFKMGKERDLRIVERAADKLELEEELALSSAFGQTIQIDRVAKTPFRGFKKSGDQAPRRLKFPIGCRVLVLRTGGLESAGIVADYDVEKQLYSVTIDDGKHAKLLPVDSIRAQPVEPMRLPAPMMRTFNGSEIKRQLTAGTEAQPEVAAKATAAAAPAEAEEALLATFDVRELLAEAQAEAVSAAAEAARKRTEEAKSALGNAHIDVEEGCELKVFMFEKGTLGMKLDGKLENGVAVIKVIGILPGMQAEKLAVPVGSIVKRVGTKDCTRMKSVAEATMAIAIEPRPVEITMLMELKGGEVQAKVQENTTDGL